MLITVLAENSHIRAVGFEGEEIRFHASVQTEPRQTSDYYILVLTQLFTLYGVSGERITGVVLASVVPQLTPTLIDALARIAGPPQAAQPVERHQDRPQYPLGPAAAGGC